MSRPDPEPITAAIVRGIADAKGVEPTELEFRLQDEIDTDALATLEAHNGGNWTIEFEVASHWVEVTSEGTVVVDGRTVG